MLGTLLIFAIGLPEAVHWYERGGALHIDGDEPGSVGQNLVDYVVLVALLPAWGLPFGVIGSAIGSAWRPRHLAPGREGRTASH